MRDRLGDWLAENDTMHYSFVAWLLVIAAVLGLLEWLL